MSPAPSSVSAPESRAPGLARRLRLFLRAELAPFPGRTAAVICQVTSLGLVMLIPLTLDVPFLMLSIIIVFFTQQENLNLTVMAGVMIIIGSTFTNTLSILMLS